MHRTCGRHTPQAERAHVSDQDRAAPETPEAVAEGTHAKPVEKTESVVHPKPNHPEVGGDPDRHPTCDACGQSVAPGSTPVKTDGRFPGHWEPRYTGEALRRIRREAIYVGGSVILYLILIGVVAYASKHPIDGTDPEIIRPFAPKVLAYLGGAFGGTMFAMKWLYHSVAKNVWNADRRYWRYFTPALSGGGALCVVLLSTSGVLPLFGTDIVRTPSGALGISIVLGYFSDRVFSALEGFAKQNMPGIQKNEATDRPPEPTSAG